MRFLHLFVVVLSVLLLATVAVARPHQRNNTHSHKQKRASFCMLKICRYMLMEHKVQNLR